MKRNMKRIRELAIALAALILLASSISAQPMAIDFGVNDTSGYPGTFVKVPVNITNVQNESIAGIIFDISFNSSVINLTMDHVQKGDLTSAWDSPRFNPDNGRISIHLSNNGTEISKGKTGSVVILNFSVVGIPGAKSAMNISRIQLSDLSGAIGTASARNGTFTIEGQQGAISGMKFNDSNGDGTKDLEDIGIANWTIVLKNSTGSLVRTITTDLNGNYSFNGLTAGNYSVEEVLHADWKQTFPEAPGIYNVTLAAGENVTYRDFGNFMNDTPAEPPGKPLITNFTPEISNVTDIIGGPTRTFTIHVNQTVNVSWQIDGKEVSNQTSVNVSSYSNDSAAAGIWNISALARNANGSDMQTWIWNVEQQIPGSISGMKFNDSNANGIKDQGESGLLNWTILLKNSTGYILDSMITDIGGNYTFAGLAAGNYTVEEVLQAGWNQTFPEAPGIYNVTLAAGESVKDRDFGNILLPEMPTGVTVTREIEKESLRFGESTNITIRINSDVTQALVLQESIPPGWNLGRISDDAQGFKNSSNEWVWSNVTPGATITVIYQLTNSTGANIGTYYINGTIGNPDGIIANVSGDNMITLGINEYYARLGSDPDRLETRDLLKAMDDWRSGKVPVGFARPITINELSALIDEWTRT
ncbi:MAG: SpaA isopeptide-forming pilin-related protein [Candidatus Methanoperedens sp.]|nr:SpaA isopeptide-forming pilin-related protein [Candidatus Methanoperedens sp.]